MRADVGLVRNESIASDLPSGAVTYARLTAVEPGRRDMVRVTVTGVQLRAALEHALDGGSPSAHIAGAQVRYDPRKPDGRRISRIVLQGNRTVRPADRYTLALDESTAEGAGGYAMLAGLPKERRGMTDVEVDAAFLRRLPQPVEVRGDGRVRLHPQMTTPIRIYINGAPVEVDAGHRCARRAPGAR